MGYTFVFDMDQTLVDYDRKEKNVVLNNKLIELLKKIYEARSMGVTDAVLLYTNNPDEKYIYMVEGMIEDEIPGFQFNDMMWAKDERRSSYTIYKNSNPPKLLEDVKRMLEDNNIYKDDFYLRNNVFFFDDIPSHYIRSEILPDHYIHINPPFTTTTEPDEEIYKPVYDVLVTSGGLRRIKKKSRRTLKLALKSKSNMRKKTKSKSKKNRS